MLIVASVQNALLCLGAIASDQPCINIAWLSARPGNTQCCNSSQPSNCETAAKHVSMMCCRSVFLTYAQHELNSRPAHFSRLETYLASTPPMLQDSNSSLAKFEVDTAIGASPAANQAEPSEVHQQLECVKDAGHDDLFQAQPSTSHDSQETPSRQAQVADAEATPVVSEGHIQATLQKVEVQANAPNRYQLMRSEHGARHLQNVRRLYHCNNPEAAVNPVIRPFQIFAVIYCFLLFVACSGRLNLVRNPR